jgi:hypothetical protein
VEFRWVVKGVQGFLRGFERLSPDRAMISPFTASQSELSSKQSLSDEIPGTFSVPHQITFLRVAIWLRFREVSVLLSLDFLRRS